MSNLFLVRHGESTSNAGHVTEGHGVYPLTDHGREQAALFTATWTGAPRLIVASKFTRAQQTSEPFRTRYAESPFETWERVVEFTQLSPEKYPGTTHAERMPNVLNYWKRNDPKYLDGPGAESFDTFIHRVGLTFNAAAERAQGKLGQKFVDDIVIFTHATFMQAALYAVLYGIPRTKNSMAAFYDFSKGIDVPNLAVMKFHFDADHEYQFGGAWSVGRIWRLGER